MVDPVRRGLIMRAPLAAAALIAASVLPYARNASAKEAQRKRPKPKAFEDMMTPEKALETLDAAAIRSVDTFLKKPENRKLQSDRIPETAWNALWELVNEYLDRVATVMGRPKENRTAAYDTEALGFLIFRAGSGILKNLDMRVVSVLQQMWYTVSQMSVQQADGEVEQPLDGILKDA